MGDSRSAIYDDEEDWGDLKRRADIKSATWDVYSPEARYAKIGFREHGYTSRRLNLYVKHEMGTSRASQVARVRKQIRRMIDILFNIVKWAREDYTTWPVRFVLEITAWFMSLTCSIVLATSATDPLFFYLYPIFITQCLIFGWSAWTRKSTGMVANYVLLATIDGFGYVRLLLS